MEGMSVHEAPAECIAEVEKTTAAVKAFRKEVKLPVDGIVGANTWNALIVDER